ncbi:RAI1 like PD-(D/E)XK nuclease domain-containing protein [Ditylenchus destructor]|uniref:Decapping nuclease n=1 Tax=Ditylenchus destructor TaxID=166010 RepID=A0AAD4R1S3_9BILA|nr:RAI1 like PD-(D/E)XK nuclease domain-containing protein [Ditylenchus destructor]
MLPSISASPDLYESATAPEINIFIKGEFSVGPERNYLRKKRASARYLLKEYDHTVSDVQLDLREGYTRWVENPRVDRLAHVQTWISKEAKEKGMGMDLVKVINSDFVTTRGVLRRIAVSPYKYERDGSKFLCRKYQNVVFMNNVDTESPSFNKSKGYQSKHSGKLREYGGHKFEQFISNRINSKPKAEFFYIENQCSINSNVEFCAVFRAQIGEIKVVYNGEIDILTPDGSEYLEAKTQYDSLGYGQDFDKKALEWWIQTHLSSVKTLVVGLRDQIGIVSKIEHVKTDSLQRYGNWTPDICFTFLQAFLKHIRILASNLADDEILIAERKANSLEFKFEILDENEADTRDLDHNIIEESLKEYFM